GHHYLKNPAYGWVFAFALVQQFNPSPFVLSQYGGLSLVFHPFIQQITDKVLSFQRQTFFLIFG
ncbi:hypothetical protein, partial [Enterobacter cloacae]|uniref:hypothetical protein n=1 Tax=Enterobacter cloacae TaxID=550 RepID=UPI0019552F3C